MAQSVWASILTMTVMVPVGLVKMTRVCFGGGGWRGCEELLVGTDQVSWVVRDGVDRQNRSPAHDLYCSPDYEKDAWWGQKNTTPLQECLVGLTVFAQGGARLICSSIPRNPTVRQTFMAGPREPRLLESWQSCVRRWGRMGRGLRGAVLMVRSAAHKREETY